MTSEELVTLREQAGMTQGQLALALGIDRRTIYRYEIGEIPIKHMKELAIRQVLAAGSSRVAVTARKSKRSAK